MERDEEDWWTPAAPLPQDGVGEFDYGYRLDGGEQVLPDPRSRRQPYGVHGWSRTYEAESFGWSDDSWTGRQLAGGIIYELHVGTFTPEGTLAAAIDRLDHLVRLGINFVELMPVNAFNGSAQLGLRRRPLVRGAGDVRRSRSATSGSSTRATGPGWA